MVGKLKLKQDDVQDLIEQADTKGDGSIDLEEFTEFLKQARALREQGLRDLVPRRLGPRPGPGGGGGGGAGARHVPGRQTPGSSKVLLHQQGRGLDRETRLTAPPSRRRWRTAKTGTRLHVS